MEVVWISCFHITKTRSLKARPLTVRCIATLGCTIVFMTVNGQKVPESLGNVLLVRDLLKFAPSEAVRLMLLSMHYRHPLHWTDDRDSSAASPTLHRFYRSLATVAQTEVVKDTGSR